MTKQTQSEMKQTWDAATWDGARREALRRWAALPLEKIIAAQEEMQELAEAFGHTAETYLPMGTNNMGNP